MLITSAEDLIIATKPLSQTEKSKVQDFISVLSSAVSLEALASIIDGVEVDGVNATYLVKVNEQHVAACVRVELDQSGSANIFVTCYD